MDQMFIVAQTQLTSCRGKIFVTNLKETKLVFLKKILVALISKPRERESVSNLNSQPHAISC